MISAIITSYKEPKTIGKAIQAIASQISHHSEILVAAPDNETLEVAKKLAQKNKQIKIIKDLGRGKPAALNLAVGLAKGDILILTDGDVFVGKNAINNILKPFVEKSVGAVSGNVISTNSKNNMLGYWAYVLTNIAHEIRLQKLTDNNRFLCTGYLFAIRKELFPLLPEQLLSEDGFISYKVYESNHTIKYAPEAKVYVKYPDNFKDWIIQKKRSAGGYNQIRKITSFYGRSFASESSGAYKLLKYIKTLKELFWMACLVFARLYLWAIIFIDINIKKKSQKDIWKRVESTK